MSREIVERIRTTVGRGCGLAALALGGLMCGLARAPLNEPFLALKAGAAGGLVAALALLGEAARPAEAGPASDLRRAALRRYALRFALLAAACALVDLAGQVNLWMYPEFIGR